MAERQTFARAAFWLPTGAPIDSTELIEEIQFGKAPRLFKRLFDFDEVVR